MHPKVTVVGNLAGDHISHIEEGDRSTTVNQSILTPGGRAFNQAIMASRLGAKVSLIGRIGSDKVGKKIIGGLQLDGIATDNIIIDEEDDTDSVHIFVHQSTPTFYAYPGASYNLNGIDIEKAQQALLQSDIILLTFGIGSDSIRKIFQLKEANANFPRIFLRPAPLDYIISKDLLNYILPLTDFVGIEKNEIKYIVDDPLSTVEEISEQLLSLGIKSVCICEDDIATYFADGTIQANLKAYPIEIVENAGGFDVFWSAFATTLASGQNITASLEFAMCACSYAINNQGVYSSIPYLSSVVTLQKKYSSHKVLDITQKKSQ